jgi:hypothetical protein
MPRAIEEGTYLESLLKNIPSEAVAAYLGITSLMSAMPVGTAKSVLQWLIFAVCLGTVPLWMLFGQSKAKWWQILFACLSFPIWAMTLVDGPFYTIQGYQAWIGGILLMLFTGLVFPLLSKMIVALSR